MTVPRWRTAHPPKTPPWQGFMTAGKSAAWPGQCGCSPAVWSSSWKHRCRVCLQIGSRPVGRHRHHLNAFSCQCLGVALAELLVSTLGRASRQRHVFGRVRLQSLVGQHQQCNRQKNKWADRNGQVAQRQRGVEYGFRHRASTMAWPCGEPAVRCILE